jgi:transcriptional regulator GlxA family with amidase domain
MMQVAIPIFDGVDELDVVGPYEVLPRAARLGADLSVQLVSLMDGATPATGQHGMSFAPHGALDGPIQLLIVPGGGWVARFAGGVRAQIAQGELPRAIAAQHANGAIVAAVCTGAMAVAAAGLLTGRPAVTHHDALQDLRATGALVVEERVVDDGDVVTAGGVTSGIDLGLWLIERLYGAEVALAVSRGLEHERRGAVYFGPRAGDYRGASGAGRHA